MLKIYFCKTEFSSKCPILTETIVIKKILLVEKNSFGQKRLFWPKKILSAENILFVEKILLPEFRIYHQLYSYKFGQQFFFLVSFEIWRYPVTGLLWVIFSKWKITSYRNINNFKKIGHVIRKKKFNFWSFLIIW